MFVNPEGIGRAGSLVVFYRVLNSDQTAAPRSQAPWLAFFSCLSACAAAFDLSTDSFLPYPASCEGLGLTARRITGITGRSDSNPQRFEFSGINASSRRFGHCPLNSKPVENTKLPARRQARKSKEPEGEVPTSPQSGQANARVQAIRRAGERPNKKPPPPQSDCGSGGSSGSSQSVVGQRMSINFLLTTSWPSTVMPYT